MNRKVCLVFAVLISILFIAMGISVLVFASSAIDYLTQSNIVLSNKGIGFGLWKAPPVPIKIQMWVWNLVNPDEMMKGEKPKLQQIGPYTYRETRTKKDINFSADEVNVSYVSERMYVFDRSESVGDAKEDTFTTINIPYITAVNLASFWSSMFQMGLTVLAEAGARSKIFECYRVHDFIWGYTDPLLKELVEIKPEDVPRTSGGLFADRNNSDDGVYVVNTGKEDSSQTNMIQSFNGAKYLSHWATPEANMVNGTDGTYNPPFVNKSHPFYVFTSDICRSIKAEFENDSSIHGIPAYRFILPPFESVEKNPDNIGFCTPNASHCLPEGLLNISNCIFGVPVVASFPHFLHADPSVLDMIGEGLSPNREEHETYFDIEPKTGAPLRLQARLQLNVHVKKYTQFPYWKHLPEVYLPILWMNQSASITEELSSFLRWLTVYPDTVAAIAAWTNVGIGVIIFFLAVSIYFKKRNKVSPQGRGGSVANNDEQLVSTISKPAVRGK